jgi:hypothetical protein
MGWGKKRMRESHSIAYRNILPEGPEMKRGASVGVVWLPEPAGVRSISQGKEEEPKAHESVAGTARFGFAGPDDRVVSLNVPALSEAGLAANSFDIEYDPEQPDMLTISLLGTDEDNFIYTIRRSMPIPARLLGELLSRRKATPQETAAWKICDE